MMVAFLLLQIKAYLTYFLIWKWNRVADYTNNTKETCTLYSIYKVEETENNLKKSNMQLLLASF